MTTDEVVEAILKIDEVARFQRVDERLIFLNISAQTLVELLVFEPFSFSTNFSGFHFMNDEKSKSEVLKIAYEYSVTPIEERDK